MKIVQTTNKKWSFLILLIALVFVVSCGKGEEKKPVAENSAGSANKVQSTVPAAEQPTVIAGPAVASDVAVSVDGRVLKKSVLEKDLQEQLKIYKDKIPAGKIKEVRVQMKQQLIDEFIMRTIVSDEVAKRKIQATDKEIKETTDHILASLPPGKKLDVFMKENKISREDIALGIKVKKMVAQDLEKRAKPSEKEIAKFYDDNKDKFTIPESVHVRHILIAFKDGDDEKIKAEKKTKIENLRNQIADGADFADIARKNSDCPSKDTGGDLGEIQKGQTVKPFEDAAFSQEKNVVGPVIATDFGYHIIQVLEHNQEKTTALAEVKDRISSFLEQQKQSESFSALVTKLRKNAKIVLNDK